MVGAELSGDIYFICRMINENERKFFPIPVVVCKSSFKHNTLGSHLNPPHEGAFLQGYLQGSQMSLKAVYIMGVASCNLMSTDYESTKT